MATKRQLVASAVCLIIVSLSLSAFAGEYPETEADFLRLPKYCKARFSDSQSPLYQKWDKILGANFIHVHHFCAALHSERASHLIVGVSPIDNQRKQSYITSAIRNIDYMEKHATPSFILFPDIYLLKAEIFGSSGNSKLATEYYRKAINANKKYSKGYVKYADYLYKIGSKQIAVEILNEGLKNASNKKIVNKRLKKYQSDKQ